MPSVEACAKPEAVDNRPELLPDMHELDCAVASTPRSDEEDENEAGGQIVVTTGVWLGDTAHELDVGKLVGRGRFVVYVKTAEPYP